MHRYRYTTWDGSQSVDLDADDIMSALSDDLLDRGDLRQALRRLMQQGMRGQNLMGMQDLIRQLQQRRQQQMDNYNLGASVDELQKALDEILKLEREGIERRLEDARQRSGPRNDAQDSSQSDQPGQQGEEGQDGQEGAEGQDGQQDQNGQPSKQSQGRRGKQGAQGGQQSGPGQPSSSQPGQSGSPDLDPEEAARLLEFMEKMAQEKRDFLSQLPEGMGGAMQQLQEYDFWDNDAKQKYDELMDRLKQQMAQNLFQNMTQGMQQMGQEQMQGLREMLQDLNQMLRDSQQGRDPSFQQFMDKWGQNFGPNPPQSLEELMEQLQNRMQQMESLMESLNSEQREQLKDMMQSMMGEMGLEGELSELASHLGQMFPQERAQSYPFRGDDPLTMQEAMRMMEEMAKLEEMESSLKGVRGPDEIPDADVEQLRELLGDDAAQQLENLRELAHKLEEAGYVQRTGNRLELTPRGIRKLGQKALRDVFDKLKQDRLGNHALPRHGQQGERDEGTKLYEFGDPFLIDLERTVRNAVERQGPGIPVNIEPNDFEIYRTEHMSQCSTVLLLDQSRSMGYTGRFLAAKKVALALQSLIKSQFPQDSLYVIGFSAYATEIKHEELPKVTWSYDSSGTNMQHALMLSRQFLSRHKGGTRQIIMVTDGEPTAHLEHGYAYFAYPPTHRTIEETLKEVQRCTKEGITINTFMLEQSYYLLEFVGQMAKLNHGRVFYAAPDNLGEYVLVDYLGQKKRKSA